MRRAAPCALLTSIAVMRLLTLDQSLARVGRKLGLVIRKVELANPLV